MTSIENQAFRNCSCLTDVYCLAEKVPVTNSVFYNVSISKATLHVPASAIEQYKATSPWSGFGNIVPITEDDVDGIGSLTPSLSESEDAWFDLNGRKINAQSSILNSQLPKGIYIKNGKKVLLK